MPHRKELEIDISGGGASSIGSGGSVHDVSDCTRSTGVEIW